MHKPVRRVSAGLVAALADGLAPHMERSGQRVRQRCDAKTVQRQAQVQSQAVGSNAAIYADAA